MSQLLAACAILLSAAAACPAQSLEFSSADSRCAAPGGTDRIAKLEQVKFTCRFTNRETMPMDYGIPVTVTGAGTWTVGPQTPATCSYRLIQAYDATGTNIQTITPPATFYLQPIYADVSACPIGTYTHVMPFTNGATTVNLQLVQTIVPRRAAPVYLNGYGVADSGLSTYGWSYGPVSPVFPSYDLNQQACANCNPGQNPLNAPPAPGSTFTDELGNVIRVITPPNFAHQNSEKAAASLNDNFVLVSDPYGNYSIWDTSGNNPWPTLNTNNDFGGQGAYCWSATDNNDLYSVITGGFKSGQSGTFKKITLASPPAYTVQTGANESSGVWWVMPASLGRVLNQTISHGDCDNSNRMPVATVKDYQATVNVSGTTVTAVSGDAFDNHLLDQPVLGQTVTAVNSPTQLTLSAAPGDQQGTVLQLTTIWNICVVDLEASGAQGTSYTPVCADVSTMSRPLINYTANPGIWLSNGVDPVSGMSYAYLGNQPYAVVGSYRPGIDTTLTLTRSFLAEGDPYSNVCDEGAVNNIPPTGAGYRCLTEEHGDVFHGSDGTQWLAVSHDGDSWSIYRFRDLASTPPTQVLEAGGYYSISQFTNYVGGEAGGARLAPYWILSTSTGSGLFAPSQSVNVCTNTRPAVLQLAQTPNYGAGATILVNGVQGNTACNGVHTAVSVSGNNVTLEVNGNGAPAPNTGAVTQNVAFTGNNVPDADQAFVLRDLGFEAHRVGHLRSVLYTNDHISSNFWAQPRMAPCMDGACAVFTTNFGLPESYQVAMVQFPHGGVLASNQFDATHAVTTSVTATGVTVSYSTPDAGPAIVEFGQSARFTDGTVPADPSGTCTAALKAVLSLASSSVFTCARNLQWGAGAPDASYQVVVDQTQSMARSATFNNLRTGVTYYYRVTANNATVAFGTVVPQ